MIENQSFNIIDCHNHSLPDIDDGATDLSMALAMLKIANECGTTDIALTPHHLNGAFSNFASDTQKRVEQLRNQAKKASIDINLHLGTEVHLVSETAQQIINNQALTYNNHGKAALLELPKNSIPSGVESILSELVFNGITPVIAHPERNSILRKDFSQLKDWVEFGCKSQLTGQSCSGDFGLSLQEASFAMISEGIVHLIASDAHRPVGRSPDLQPAKKAVEEMFGFQICKTLLHDNPLKLINGKDLINLKPTNSYNKSSHKKDSLNRRQPYKRKKSLLRRLIDFK